VTPAQFAKRMKKIGDLVVANADAGYRATALLVDQVVTFATPVDTGRARANWRASAERPLYTTTESTDADASLNASKAAIAGDRSGVIYITNNLDYIGALNDGSSAQAPAGFVEQAVQAGLTEASRIRLLRGA
jgi:hypothetical protein